MNSAVIVSVLSVPAREPRHSSQVDTVRPPATPSHNALEQQTFWGEKNI